MSRWTTRRKWCVKGVFPGCRVLWRGGGGRCRADHVARATALPLKPRPCSSEQKVFAAEGSGAAEAVFEPPREHALSVLFFIDTKCCNAVRTCRLRSELEACRERVAEKQGRRGGVLEQPSHASGYGSIPPAPLLGGMRGPGPSSSNLWLWTASCEFVFEAKSQTIFFLIRCPCAILKPQQQAAVFVMLTHVRQVKSLTSIFWSKHSPAHELTPAPSPVVCCFLRVIQACISE